MDFILQPWANPFSFLANRKNVLTCVSQQPVWIPMKMLRTETEKTPNQLKPKPSKILIDRIQNGSGRTGRNWLSLLPHWPEGRQGLWTLEEECRRRPLGCSSVTCKGKGNCPYNHCLFLPLIVHPWLADPVLLDAALPLYLHIPRVSRNGAGNLAVQGSFSSLLRIPTLNKKRNVSPSPNGHLSTVRR